MGTRPGGKSFDHPGPAAVRRTKATVGWLTPVLRACSRSGSLGSVGEGFGDQVTFLVAVEVAPVEVQRSNASARFSSSLGPVLTSVRYPTPRRSAISAR